MDSPIRWLRPASLGLLVACHHGSTQVMPTPAEQCSAATRVLDGSSMEHRASWAWQQIAYCDATQRADVLTRALARARTSHDHEFLGPALGFVAADWGLFLLNEVIGIAGDRSATVESRVFAFVTLAILKNPRSAPSYDSFVGGLMANGIPRGGCGGMRTDVPAGTVLDAARVQAIVTLASRVSHDPAEPPDVRSAAACAM